MKVFKALSGLSAFLLFAGCSNLFETIYNEDGSEKTGDSSISVPTSNTTSSANMEISEGLVVIKASDAFCRWLCRKR
ncbi:MAG: hypothetical protein IKN34_08200 [Treponema sp.]|nr:hypothetical protein [Treponema sp.]